MKKRKTIRETKSMIQTALWLPRDMHELLKQAGGERGLGDEIRRRLQLTFVVSEQRPSDPFTDLLLNLIKQIGQNPSLCESWRYDRFAFDVFKAAINELLDLISNIRPKNEPQPSTVAKFQANYGADQKPEAIGRMLARSALVEHANEKVRQEFADNQKG